MSSHLLKCAFLGSLFGSLLHASSASLCKSLVETKCASFKATPTAFLDCAKGIPECKERMASPEFQKGQAAALSVEKQMADAKMAVGMKKGCKLERKVSHPDGTVSDGVSSVFPVPSEQGKTACLQACQIAFDKEKQVQKTGSRIEAVCLFLGAGEIARYNQ